MSRLTARSPASTHANGTLNIFINYVNGVADTEIDFPVVRTGKPA